MDVTCASPYSTARCHCGSAAYLPGYREWLCGAAASVTGRPINWRSGRREQRPGGSSCIHATCSKTLWTPPAWEVRLSPLSLVDGYVEEPFLPMELPVSQSTQLPTFITPQVSWLGGLIKDSYFSTAEMPWTKPVAHWIFATQWNRLPRWQAVLPLCPSAEPPVLSSPTHPAWLPSGCPVLKKRSAAAFTLRAILPCLVLVERCDFSFSSGNSRLTIYHD